MTVDALIEPIGGGDWDLVIGDDGDLALVGDSADTYTAAVLQRVAFVLLTWLGESPFDRSLGFPWEESVFGKQPLDGIAALIQSRVLGVEGVTGVDPPTLDLDNTTRTLTVSVIVHVGEFSAPVAVQVVSA